MLKYIGTYKNGQEFQRCNLISTAHAILEHTPEKIMLDDFDLDVNHDIYIFNLEDKKKVKMELLAHFDEKNSWRNNYDDLLDAYITHLNKYLK